MNRPYRRAALCRLAGLCLAGLRLSGLRLSGLGLAGLGLAGSGLATLAPATAAASTLTLQRIDNSAAVISVVTAPAGGTASAYALNLSGGTIRAIEADGSLRAQPVLDAITDPEGETLGNVWDIAFAPDHATSGRAYLSFTTYTEDAGLRSYSHVVAEVLRDPTDPDRFDPGSLRRILTVPHPDAAQSGAHFGGALSFGPDDMLYVTTGDSWLPRQGLNIAQDVTDMRGAILRIDPTGDDFPSDPLRNHAIPAGQPDFGPDADPALWAIGLRNPFKARWDGPTGRYFIADVGEDDWEEINLGLAGANYGWSAWEGPDPLAEGELSLLGTLTFPLYSYPHDLDSPFGGISVTGGEVYRGPLAALDGQYIFGDYNVSGAPGRIWSFDAAASMPGAPVALTAWTLEVEGPGALRNIIGFGSDSEGRFYVSDIFNGLYVITGATAAVAVIPLPASLGFTLGGIALLGGLALRRRRAAS